MGEDEIRLAKVGDNEAIEKILMNYKDYISRSSKLFYLNGGDREDLKQEGYIGLLKAIKYFDKKKCDNFDVFAHLCIKRQIFTAIRKSNNMGNQGLNSAVEEDESKISKNKNFEKSIDFYSPEDILISKELISLLHNFLLKNLTRMERRVVFFLFRGYSYKDIAERLSEDPKKIDNCIQRIKRKVEKFKKYYYMNN